LFHKKTSLENGIRVVTEALPYVESAAVGIWVQVGSRDEGPTERGLCHFIEHTVFKGTERRSALEIVKEIEAVGGSINAFASREYTCFHAKVLGRDLPLALDVLSDLVARPLFDPQEVEREKMVVLQEIKMTEDTPEDYIHDLFNRSFWGGHPLGAPITGEEETVRAFTSEKVREFFHRHWRPERMVVAAAGRLEHEEVVDLVHRHLGALEGGGLAIQRVPPDGAQGGVKVFRRDLEQVHLCLGVQGVPHTDPRRFPAMVLNTLLGGNMSSRLFQEVREKRGLTYAIYSFLHTYSDAGVIGVYAGTTSEEVQEVTELIARELEAVREGRVSEGEVSVAKEYLKGGLILGLESPEGRMARLAKNEIYFGRHIPPEETLGQIEGVSLEEVIQVGGELFDVSPCTVLLGEVPEGVIQALPWSRC